MLGNGGHAKVVAESIEALGEYEIVGFVSDRDTDFEYRSYRIVGTDDDLEHIYQSGVKLAFVCIGYMGKGNIRKRLFERLKEIGYELPIIADVSAKIAGDVKIGEGTYVGKAAVINADAKVGKMAIINTSSVVEHDCVVEDYTHVSVNATLCGGVSVGKSCFIGANAVVIQNVSIGAGSIIGAGGIVLNNVGEKKVICGVFSGAEK